MGERRGGGDIPGMLAVLRIAAGLLFRAAPIPVAATFVLQAIMGLVPLVELTALARAVNTVVADGRDASITGPAVVLALAVAVRHLGQHLLDAFAVNVWVGPAVMRHVLALVARTDPARFDDPAFLDLQQRAGSGVAAQAGSTLFTLGEGLRSLTGAVSLVGLLSVLDWGLVLVAVAGSVPVLVLTQLDGRDASDAWTGDTVEGRMRGYLGQLLRDPAPGPELRALGLAPTLLARLRELFADRVRVLAALAGRSRNRALAAGALQAAVTVAGLTLLIGRGINGETDPGEIAAGVGALAALGAFLSRLAAQIGLLSTITPYLLPAYDLEQADRSATWGDRVLPAGPLGVELRNVSFSYPGSQQLVLSDASLRVAPGELVALVGENGAGKSTLVRLAMGILRAQSGTVSVGGVDVADLDRDRLWRRIAFLPQFPVRLELPLREAVALGRGASSTDVEIEAALRAVGGDALLRDVGLDGILGRAWDDGHDLSGGQWQRVSLARLVHAGADLWILDEPTANLDPAAEAAFVRSLPELLDGATCIFVSHRFSTVRAADRIAVIEGHQVSEIGSHDELVAAAGTYARLFETQAAGYR